MFWIEVERDVLQVSGPDAASYLQSQLSNDLRTLAVGSSLWSFVLEPTGRIDALLRVWRTADETFVLDTDAGAGSILMTRLQRFKIRVKADLEMLDWRCIAVRGEGAAEVDGLASWGGGTDLLGSDVLPPPGVEAGRALDLLAARIEAVWPAMGSEIEAGQTIPAETGITAVAVSFTKGCYPGQELVERMDSRGASAPRLLRAIDVQAGTRAGDPVILDGVEVGRVTSVVGERALAYLKRSALETSPS